MVDTQPKELNLQTIYCSLDPVGPIVVDFEYAESGSGELRTNRTVVFIRNGMQAKALPEGVEPVQIPNGLPFPLVFTDHLVAPPNMLIAKVRFRISKKTVYTNLAEIAITAVKMTNDGIEAEIIEVKNGTIREISLVDLVVACLLTATLTLPTDVSPLVWELLG